MLRPVLRYCLAHALKLTDIIECCKLGLVTLAKESMRSNREAINASRINVMTGVHRPDIKRLLDEEYAAPQRRNLVIDVVARWQTDSEFITKGKRPRVLSFGTDDSEFNRLVRKISTNLNPASILYELERTEAVEKTSRGVRLLAPSYTPHPENSEGIFAMLEQDINNLICAVEENIAGRHETRNLHARTEYDTVRPEHIPALRQWLLREGHALHKRARDYISQLDQDINPDPNFSGSVVKVTLGTFSRISEGEDS